MLAKYVDSSHIRRPEVIFGLSVVAHFSKQKYADGSHKSWTDAEKSGKVGSQGEPLDFRVFGKTWEICVASFS